LLSLTFNIRGLSILTISPPKNLYSLHSSLDISVNSRSVAFLKSDGAAERLNAPTRIRWCGAISYDPNDIRRHHGLATSAARAGEPFRESLTPPGAETARLEGHSGRGRRPVPAAGRAARLGLL